MEYCQRSVQKYAETHVAKLCSDSHFRDTFIYLKFYLNILMSLMR